MLEGSSCKLEFHLLWFTHVYQAVQLRLGECFTGFCSLTWGSREGSWEKKPHYCTSIFLPLVLSEWLFSNPCKVHILVFWGNTKVTANMKLLQWKRDNTSVLAKMNFQKDVSSLEKTRKNAFSWLQLLLGWVGKWDCILKAWWEYKGLGRFLPEVNVFRKVL